MFTSPSISQAMLLLTVLASSPTIKYIYNIEISVGVRVCNIL